MSPERKAFVQGFRLGEARGLERAERLCSVRTTRAAALADDYRALGEFGESLEWVCRFQEASACYDLVRAEASAAWKKGVSE